MSLATGNIYVGDGSNHPAASSDIHIVSNKVGIGTSSPLGKLDIYGSLILSGDDRYINFGTTTGANSYGFRDSNGTLQYRNTGDTWTSLTSLGVSTFDGLTDVNLSGAATGSLVYYNGS